jgi:hypothetical protein
MGCILKSCAHAKTTRCASLHAAGLGDCGAAYALDLAKRNDGYLVIARENPTIDALKRAGLITTTDVTGGYLIARAVQPTAAPYRYRHDAAGLARAAEIGRAL